ncbi:hypothetical protein [Altererythrobacter sp. Root672]|uniref:hypothetical protein n=1 Tax=Altererythrobacter sp. Root672 TaxID=1736584 RepID=UPI0006FAA1B0|nr:hypothetical protein [Altererythrobacter sp. Root672]KRA81698.1 hypothetical protein ASD76_13815 [Altererythrobacter sp. Root672]
MSGVIKSRLRDFRYALPNLVERIVPGQEPAAAAAQCAEFAQQGFKTTAGFFGAGETSREHVIAANRQVAHALAQARGNTLLAVKAPALGFDPMALRRIAASGVPLVFDALTEPHAEQTVALAQEFCAGIALPARWRRSAADAERLRDEPCRIRLVKGEWADPGGDVPDVAAAYLELASILAGRWTMVGVATHDPRLAETALGTLLDAGTPCELELIRGLPRRRTLEVARRMGVPVRLYYPFGPGWWPYAIDKALSRPYLPVWAVRDMLGF